MANKIKQLLQEIEKLKNNNKKLSLQLQEARDSISAIKTGNIDAVVVGNKTDLTIFTEKSSDKTYRLLIEKMHEGALTLNKEGTILYCNSYFAGMVKLPMQKVIGAQFSMFVVHSLKFGFKTLSKHKNDQVIQEETYLQTSDGSTIPVLMSVNYFSLDNNFTLSVILTNLTIQKKSKEELINKTTQLEQNNIELENANKELMSFTFLSSHDLQEPLRKIQIFVSLLEEEKNLSATGKKYFLRLRLTAKRMRDLIDDLLTYSRSRNREQNFISIGLDTIIEEVKKDFEEELLEKNATVKTIDLCEVNIIRFQFRQLFQNLISNSLKFSHPSRPTKIILKGKLVQKSKTNGLHLVPGIDYCHIIYTDNGIGFDAKYNERIFEIFQRLHSKEDYMGTGMGLAICKKIIENHHGFINASGKLHKGARFDIYIPTVYNRNKFANPGFL